MPTRFNPPPNWPQLPSRDWTPPPGWRPDPAWGPLPPGWKLWVDDFGIGAHAVSQPQRNQRPWYKKKRFIIPLGALALFIIIVIFTPTPQEDPEPTSASQPSAATSSASAQTVAATEMATKAPPPPELTQEQQFIALIEEARDEADDAENDFQKRLPLTNRGKAICKLLKSKTVSDWTGEVKTLNTNGDGLGILTIEIADGVQVSTWNNAFSDFEDNTLIQTDSPVFAAMSSLSEGDQVAFTGRFVTDPESCIGEQSMTDNGSTQTPTFTMRFSDVAMS